MGVYLQYQLIEVKDTTMNLLLAIELYEKKYATQLSLNQYISTVQLGLSLLPIATSKKKLAQEEEKAIELAKEYSEEDR